MNIPTTVIKEYLHQKFNKFKLSGDEFITDSVLVDDAKGHLSINVRTGLWQDFKSSEYGNFASFVAMVESISYGAAIKMIRRKMFDSPEMLFSEVKLQRAKQEPIGGWRSLKQEEKNFEVITKTFQNDENPIKRIAYRFLQSRSLLECGLMLATSGKYVNRIIIPYKERGDLIYFQARLLFNTGMKYLNPTAKEYGVRSSEILYPFDTSKDYVLITEGPIDALTLQRCGFNATALQGSNLSRTQLDALGDRTLIFSFDNDEAGRNGLNKAERAVQLKNKSGIYYAFPDSEFKDWNEVLSRQGVAALETMMKVNTKPLNFESKIIERLA